MEKRKTKRLPVKMELNVSSLFRQDNVKVELKDTPLYVTDISRGGIGFECDAILPIGYYFNAKLQLGEGDSVLYTVVKIIRGMEGKDNMTAYGCEFVGLAPVLGYIFDEFEEKFAKDAE